MQRMRRARKADAGLTEEVWRRRDGGKRPARCRSIGGRLRRGGGILEAVLRLETESREELRTQHQSGEETHDVGERKLAAEAAAAF
jgi:hypothetical protein